MNRPVLTMGEKQMDRSRLPRHIAIIMDGNGRWAKRRGMPRLAGHDAGVRSMKEIVRRCSDLGIQHLTVYVFSTENWRRSVEEISGIFDLLVYYVDHELAELDANNVCVSLVGDLSGLPADALDRIRRTMETTKKNTGLGFHLAINYGGRDELVRAARRFAREVSAARATPDDLTEERFATFLDTADLPDPDLVIRPGGEYRSSNFLLWQTAYSEWVYCDVLWPDFTVDELEKAIMEYQRRTRRFGGEQ